MAKGFRSIITDLWLESDSPVQSFGWYARRLRSMSAGEIGWRLGNKVTDSLDRFLLSSRQHEMPPARLLNGSGGTSPSSSHDAIGKNLPEVGSFCDTGLGVEWLARLREQADKIEANRLDLFDMRDVDLGSPVGWNREFKACKDSPLKFSADVDYRDYDSTGDCKFVWEPNRHHQLVVLGRCFRATGEKRYAEAVVRLLSDWLEQCPYGVGMNWRSPLELAIRLINWSWALELIAPSGVCEVKEHGALLTSLHRHIWEIDRKYSRYSSANNHLIGEAAGVFIASSCFGYLAGAERWRRRSQEILAREIIAQTYSDGMCREQAVGYHLFVMQFFVLAGLVARNTGHDFHASYWDRLEQMFEFIGQLCEGGDHFPMIGDCDDGYVLDLGGRGHIVSSWMAAGAVLFDRADFKVMAGQASEPLLWLLGGEGMEQFDRISTEGTSGQLQSRAFPDSGYYMLQKGDVGSEGSVSVVVDCGELGFQSIAAHGHADALSLTLRVSGDDVLVDPGTYDYFTYPEYRSYFRSTRAHNTVVVDGQDQSEMQGLFLWGHKAKAVCREWKPESQGGKIVAEHDGYRRLSDSVNHQRTVILDADSNVVVVEDELSSSGNHIIEVFWHLSEQCSARQLGEHSFEIDHGRGAVAFEFDPRLESRAITGCEDPVMGWVSRGYHSKNPSTTLVCRGLFTGDVKLATKIRLLV